MESQEIESRIELLRRQMTEIVHSGQEENTIIIRRLLAELERLEQMRMMQGKAQPVVA